MYILNKWTAPATTGDAMLVPLNCTIPPPAFAAGIKTPGANTVVKESSLWENGANLSTSVEYAP